MLRDKDVHATIPVRDIAAAARFYEETLGLQPVGEQTMGVREYQSGRTKILVYESNYAGTNQATAATWMVGKELESIVEALEAKGVKFEQYDFPEGRREGAIHVFGEIRNAWLKDPDGNILSLVNG